MPAFGLAALVLLVALSLNLPTPAGSQQSAPEPGTWEEAERLDSQCPDPQQPDPADERCVGHASHVAVALDRFGCLDPVPPQKYPCGKVLVAGGTTLPRASEDGLSSSRFAKLYDPATDSWTPTARLQRPRGSSPGKPPAAVLLDGPECRVTAGIPEDHCGDVLVVGEDNRAPGLSAPTAATSEVYDPVAKEWSSVRELPGLFSEPTAVLLEGPGCADKCGMVLVTGGQTGVAALYDPRAKEWTVTPGPTFSHKGSNPPTATLLFGPGCADKCGNVLLAGGANPAGEPNQVAELYDPTRDAWLPTGRMKVPRNFHSAALLDGFQCVTPDRPDWCGTVLIVGGNNENDTPYRSAERYLPEGGDWVMAASSPDNEMSHPRQSPSITSLGDGRVVVIGGRRPPVRNDLTPTHDQQDAPQLSGDVYDPSTGRWTPTREGPEEDEASYRAEHSVTRLPRGPLSGCGTRCGAVLVAAGTGKSARADSEGLPGFSDIVSADLFYPTPAISRVVPPSCGGTEVSIIGTGLASTAEVRFDGSPAASFRVHPQRPDSDILAVSPHAAAGTQAVTVTTTGGSASPKSFSFPSPPSISSLTPDRGPVAGGTPVTITGSNLGGISAVRFGSQPASAFQVLSDTRISAVSPSNLVAETVGLSVTVADCTAEQPFTYFTLPLDPVDPGGPVSGGAGNAQDPGVDPRGPVSSSPPQQPLGGAPPPATTSAPPPSGTAPATLSAPVPASLPASVPGQVPGSSSGQSFVPTLVSGTPVVSPDQLLAPGAAIAAASSSPEEKPALRHGMVRVNPAGGTRAWALSWLTVVEAMLLGCFACGGGRREPRPGPQGAY